ncbi:hypothetical protein JL2886_01787 [Phaeobacter gallaeciensis]|uniref:Uncharacterized protein n=1 Tax=Phaeobacter gallaeciensis TaxID=60890 RepID=A0A1B0ZR92_9RHOB|nr:hypothetical protein JL2886_01787 [Phaeobacter gallaeciensis]
MQGSRWTAPRWRTAGICFGYGFSCFGLCPGGDGAQPAARRRGAMPNGRGQALGLLPTGGSIPPL